MNSLYKACKLLVASSLSVLVAAAGASEVTWPNKPVQLVVPFAPGGNTDMVARILAGGLSHEIKQPVVVENRAGAGSLIATNYVANAQPDGYTLLLNTVALVTTPLVSAAVDGDLASKFAPVAQVASVPKVLITNPSFPANSVAELVAYAKKAEKPLTYGTPGNGSVTHLMGELFAMEMGVPLVQVPYRGSAPALTGLMGGEIDMIFEDLPPATPFINSGKLKALVMASNERNTAFPNVASAGEQHLSALIVEPWNGVLAPAQTPPAVVHALEQAIAKVVASEDYRSRLAKASAQATYRDSQAYGQFIQTEAKRWAQVVQKAGIEKQ
ncbi:tripartite tricarboxylate transporter substrate binding protein [Lampropedia puyangensis]|uniref:Tripartite tricarboxylate transporter substrate binding protein n=1 Tax=Lampropedia puyangensis TaxID=1330072 RepID=A0A4S8F698_9BURK|nr:tripartite tricarboxylate transporter substrate binding protein [Lampropedia puyangensis]THU02597.1 tripartite tricarboxylate transporter substrate binding protein [Lampropedia puyangensis]